MTSPSGSKSIILSLKHHFCEVNDEGRRSMQSHLEGKTHFFPWACYFLDGLFLAPDLMEGEPLCQSSAAVKAVATCGEGRICFRSFSSSKQAEFHSSRSFIIGVSLERKENDRREKLRICCRAQSHQIWNFLKNQKKQHTDEMLEFKMPTRSLGIITTIQLYLMCKNNNKSACDRFFSR